MCLQNYEYFIFSSFYLFFFQDDFWYPNESIFVFVSFLSFIFFCVHECTKKSFWQEINTFTMIFTPIMPFNTVLGFTMYITAKFQLPRSNGLDMRVFQRRLGTITSLSLNDLLTLWYEGNINVEPHIQKNYFANKPMQEVQKALLTDPKRGGHYFPFPWASEKTCHMQWRPGKCSNQSKKFQIYKWENEKI